MFWSYLLWTTFCLTISINVLKRAVHLYFLHPLLATEHFLCWNYEPNPLAYFSVSMFLSSMHHLTLLTTCYSWNLLFPWFLVHLFSGTPPTYMASSISHVLYFSSALPLNDSILQDYTLSSFLFLLHTLPIWIN